MITEYNCEYCNCNTTSQTGSKIYIQIDKDKKDKFIKNKFTYENEINVFNKKIKNTKKEFISLVEKHNKLVHWYNFKKEWYLEIYNEICYIKIKINIKNGYSWDTVKYMEITRPFLEPILYKFIECPICNHKKYLE